MKNLKKILSMALATVMVMSLMIVGAGAADFSDAESIENADAVQVVSALNIIGGYPDGTFKPEKSVSRAEMAKMICVALNGGEEPVLGVKDTPTYNDVRNSADAWAESYIEYCTNLGIVSGVGGGRFNPSRTVTGAEAAKMLLVALGYDSDVFGFTGTDWAINVGVQANTAKLYNGLSTAVADMPLTRDQAAQMVYNALDAKIMERSYDKILSNGQISYNYVLSDYKTLLNDKYNAWKVEGVVMSNEYASLLSNDSHSRDGETTLAVTNQDELQTANRVYALDINATNVFKTSTGKDEVGKAVTLFVRPAATSTNTTRATVLSTAIINDDNTVGTVTANKKNDSNVNSWLSDAGLRLDSNSVLVTDYGTIGTAGSATATALTNLGNGVEVTAVDNDADGYVDYVFKTTYTFTKVASVNTSAETITLTGASSSVPKDMEDVVAYDGIAKNDYVLYTTAGGRTYIVKPETVSGEITAYTYNGTSEDSITIGGTTLKVAGTPVAAAESAWNAITTGSRNGVAPISWNSNLIGKNTTIYLDANGYAAVMGSSSALSADNICLVAKVAQGDLIGTGAQVYVYFADGTYGTYRVTSYNGDSDFARADIPEMSICTYTLSDNGIALVGGADLHVSGQTGTVSLTSGSLTIAGKNQSALTIGSTTTYANAETVYFLVDSTKALGTKDYVTVVTGMNSVGTNVYNYSASPAINAANGSGAQIVYNITNGTNQAIGVLGVKAGASEAAFASDLIFVVDTAYTMNGQTKQINVIMPGETTVTKLTVDRNETVVVGLYEYSIDANGVYDLNRVGYTMTSSDPTFGGYIDCVNDQVVYLNNQQYTITRDTIIIDVTDSDDPIQISAADLRELDAYGYVTWNSNEEAIAIYVTGNYARLTSFGGKTVTVTVDGSMGTRNDPLVVTVSSATGFTFDTADTNKLIGGYDVISGAVNEDVQVFTDASFNNGATSITTGTYYVSVAADNAQTVYYQITVS